MAATSLCTDTTDAVELFEPQGLWLKPIARVNVSVQLPQLKTPGKSISNWEVMEKLRQMIRPDQFTILKVVKSTLEFIRFEGELENKNLNKVIISRLDAKTIKLSGFPEQLKVRAAEAKIPFPTRHDWDSWFRDAKNMNEMKPGERPDTIYFKGLPSKWFANKKDKDKDSPSEYMVKKVFETYGEIRTVDIPMLDPYRREMTAGGAIQSFSTFTTQDLTFEAYVQYKEYISFVKAMTALRGMKLMFIDEDEKAFTCPIKADFDQTKHLSDKHIKKRRLEREHLIKLEKMREERVRKEREAEERKMAEERRKKEEEEKERERKRQEKVYKRNSRRYEREEKRKRRLEEERQREEERQMQLKIALEERKILIAQRKLETIRILSELFNRIKVIKQQEELERREKELEEERLRQVELEKKRKLEAEHKKIENERKKRERLEKQERELRDRILKNMKVVEKRRAEKRRENLRQKLVTTAKTRLKSSIHHAGAVAITASNSASSGASTSSLTSRVHNASSTTSSTEPSPAKHRRIIRR